jgi:FkbM family methyltransferase
MLPYGLVRAIELEKRFADLGLGFVAACRAVASGPMRGALAVSRAECLPRSLRSRLSLVVDVGANDGRWLSALQRIVPIDHAECFEPNPAAYALLQRRFRGHPEVRLHQAALGERQGSQTLYMTQKSVFSSLLPPSTILKEYAGGAVVSTIEVPVSTLDNEVSATDIVDLLKIDVQGFERYVLKGAVRTLTQTRSLLVEMTFFSRYEGDDTFTSLYQLLTDHLGFKFWSMSPIVYHLDGRALLADFVFINSALAMPRRADRV